MKAFNVLFCFLVALGLSGVYADPWKNLQQGDKTAQELLNQSNQKKKEAGNHPFYSGIPNESKLSDKQLEGRTQNVAQKSEVKQMIVESANKRPQFTLDPLKDPLFTGSQKILDKPIQAIGGEETRASSLPGKTTTEVLTCEEARDLYPQTCTSEIFVPVDKIKEPKEWRGTFQFLKCSRAEDKGHYQPCAALRQAVFQAQRALRKALRVRKGLKNAQPKQTPVYTGTALNITGPYKACIQELNSKRTRNCGHCNTLISVLPFQEGQIKEVFLIQHPQYPSLLTDFYDFHTYNSGRFEYNCKPHIKIVYEVESYKIHDDEEILHCDHLEERVRLGLCSYQSKTCSQGKQTRLIKGCPVTRDCWQYTLTYACGSPSKNDCGPLRARGCAQTSSACKQYVGNICTVNTQTYTCTNNSQPKHSITGGQTPFCLDGNCRDQSWESNDEMMTSVAQLSILKEMQGQIGKDLTVFQGADNRCTKYILNFKDCCGAGKGWGKDIGLSSCSSGEKELNEKRKKRLCHYVGSYCSKKAPVMKTCLQKEYTYCCFNNKLLKAFHEQGRQQINLGWGDPKTPLCRGFTVAELQRIDFSKLDLREVFEELMQKFQTGKNKSNAPGMGKHIGQRMETIKKGMVPPNQKQPKQREEGA